MIHADRFRRVEPPAPRSPEGPRNEFHGSPAAAVQAQSITGDVTITTHPAPGRWRWTVLWAVLLVACGTALGYAVTRADPPEPLFAAVRPVAQRCSTDWFTPRSPEEVRALRPAGIRSWTDFVDGAAADAGPVLVTLQAVDADRGVTITGVDVEVLSRAPAPAGTVLWARCGDPETLRYLDIDLDAPTPTAAGRPVDPNAVQVARERGWRTEPIAFPYEITSTDSETFLLNATTASCDCTWTVHFDWSSGGETGTLTLPEAGGAFRVVSGRAATRCEVGAGVEC